ncbi:CCA tRNA nucleotidyltransferase [Parasphaerochaeta coccoides]|uniref:CCA tRNA nucleotidyltransferase n=1 Tax=Parasphaerochaeta coccoides TaxID=273376 RepID=UPI00059D74D7|nr:CCA tRNA nucleotidyltransferase [Parasphaerochaeta coccoides]
MKNYPVPAHIQEFSSFFARKGLSLYIVGGAVRDWLLGIRNEDFDFATDAMPEEVMDTFHKVIPTGIKHGTVTVLFRKQQYEVTTFRVDGDYSDGRHPDSVAFVRNLEQDLARRDFTINALAVNAYTGVLTDLHDGIGDLKRKVIRAIGDPEARLSEDALRIVRACRFAGKLGFAIEDKTFTAMKKLSPGLEAVSGERIHEELSRMLLGARPSACLRLLQECDALKIFMPELDACVGIEQGGYHIHDVFTHSLLACDAAAKNGASLNVRYAALFHDIGKPETRGGTIAGGHTFYKHEFVSERLTAMVCERLKFSRADTERILLLVRSHMLHYTEDWTDAAVRRFIRRIGVDALDELFALHMADQEAIAGKSSMLTLGRLPDRIREQLHAGTALSVKDLTVDGKVLMAAGIPAGRHMGTIFQDLLELVTDSPEKNTPEILIAEAQMRYRKIKEQSSTLSGT